MKTLIAFLTLSRFRTCFYRSVILFIFLLLSFATHAQKKPVAPVAKDTTNTVLLSDSLQTGDQEVIKIKSYASRYNPRKALLYSAIFPGAGQAYNNKYWKLPLVYGGFVGGIYVVSAYQNFYSEYRAGLFSVLQAESISATTGLTYKGLSETQLRTVVNRYRRQRDYMVILTGIWYILQMVDAHVDAHLKEFDLNPELKNLKASIEPMMENTSMTGRNTGVSLIIKF